MRSMQTARKSTGGKAPRKQLANPSYDPYQYDRSPSPRRRSPFRADVRPAKKLRFSVSSRPIKVVVGTSAAAVEYTFHEDLLGKHSAFFAAAMNGKWRESDEGTIYLRDDDPALFEVFANFVYTGKIYCDMLEDNSNATSTTDSATQPLKYEDDDSTEDEDWAEDKAARAKDTKEWNLLGDCYLLGDKLLSHTFKSATIDAMARKLSKSEDDMPLDLCLLAYNHTIGDSGLKRLAVDIACGAWREDDFKDVDCVEFLRDVAVQWCRCKGHPVPRDELCEMGCEYHDHGDDEMCYLHMW